MKKGDKKQVKITRDTITCMDKDRKTDMACKYEIDSTRTPWMITMTCTEGEHKGKTLKLPFGEFPLSQAVSMPVVDLIHHHGQIAYIQTLLGDTEDHLLMS